MLGRRVDDVVEHDQGDQCGHVHRVGDDPDVGNVVAWEHEHMRGDRRRFIGQVRGQDLADDPRAMADLAFAVVDDQVDDAAG
jgi:hypothetical protein